MEGTSLLIWGIMFGAIGLGFFTYGRRQKAVVPLLAGIALFIFPYFISNVYMLVIAGCCFSGATLFCENVRQVTVGECLLSERVILFVST